MWSNSESPPNPSLTHGLTGFIHQPRPRSARPVFSLSDHPAGPPDPALSLPTPSSSPVPRSKDPSSRLTIEQLARCESEFGDSDTLSRALDALPPRGSMYNFVSFNREEEDEYVLSAGSFGLNEISDACKYARDLYDYRVAVQPTPPKVTKPVTAQPSSSQAYLTPPSSPETEPERGSAHNEEVDDFSLDAESTLVDECSSEPLGLQESNKDGAPTDINKLTDLNANESLESNCYEDDDDYDYFKYDNDDFGDDNETVAEDADEVVDDPTVQTSLFTSVHLSDLRNLTASPVNLPDLTSELDLSSFPEWPVARGGFGEVWKGDIMHEPKRISTKAANEAGESRVRRKAVAVKRLTMYTDKGEEGARKVLKRTAREIHIWSRLRHRNILPLLGFCSFRGGIGIVSPWQEAGNATAWVNENPGANRLELCEGVCAGLVYLHENNVIHGDLRGANVLISPYGTPRLIDFGLASVVGGMSAFSASSNPAGTVRWMAPELQVVDGQGTTRASDIFALGMTMLELHTGASPFSSIRNDLAVLLKYQRGERPPRPGVVRDNRPTGSRGSKGADKSTICVSMDDTMWGLVQRCWDQTARKRPAAKNVLREVQRHRKIVGFQ